MNTNYDNYAFWQSKARRGGGLACSVWKERREKSKRKHFIVRKSKLPGH